MTPTNFHKTRSAPPSPLQPPDLNPQANTMSLRRPTLLDNFLKEVKSQFESRTHVDELLAMSKKLQAELQEQLRWGNSQAMLPSFNFELPTGEEGGRYLAIEVGGSNLRIAVVELYGREPPTGLQPMKIRCITSIPIDTPIRQLKKYTFFDWIAERTRDLLIKDIEDSSDGTSFLQASIPGRLGLGLRMGVAWSFPIDQTSIGNGTLKAMGKGFECSEYLIGQDLGDIIIRAFERVYLEVRTLAIVNDSSAALLCHAYLDPATRFATVLGTGLNAAIYLPIAALDPQKFGLRSLPSGTITHVLTNTELSMFGKSTFPTTRWDKALNATHILPDYQPFEYLIAGKYIGEIVRLIIAEATRTAGLFGGVLPLSLADKYTLDTGYLACIDVEKDLSLSCAIFGDLYPGRYSGTYSPHSGKLSPSEEDMAFVQAVVRWVIYRSGALFTVGIHALTTLLREIETVDIRQLAIACNGSIINHYPNYLGRAQATLDQFHDFEGLEDNVRVSLKESTDSAVLGAAVAVAMAFKQPMWGQIRVKGYTPAVGMPMYQTM